MATNYPNGYDSLTNPTGTDALSSPAHASQHADANDAIEAIQATLGLNPEGAYANVDARLDALVTDAAAAASSYADASSASAGSALASAGSAAAAAGTAYSYQQGAETNANQAALSAGSAYTSMLAAAASESAAAISAGAAATSAASIESYADLPVEFRQFAADGSVLANLPARVHPAEQLLKQAVWWIDAAHSSASGQSVSNLGWGASALDARLGSASGADSNDPKFLDFDGTPYVYLPAATTNSMIVSDTAYPAMSADLDVRVLVSPQTSKLQYVAGSGTGSALVNKWMIGFNSDNSMRGWASWTGGYSYLNAPAPTLWSTNAAFWVRLVIVGDNGTGVAEYSFYESADGEAWIQCGTTTALTFAWDMSLCPDTLRVSTYVSSGDTYDGKVFRVVVLNGINGTPVLDIDTSVLTSGSATSFTALTGQTVTINRSTSGRKSVAVTHPCWLFGTDDYMEVPARWVDASSGGLFLPGVAGNYASAPDSAAVSVTGDLTVDCYARLDDWTPSPTQVLVAKWGSTTADLSYMLRVEGTGYLQLHWYDSGALYAESTAATGLADGAAKWIRATLDVDNGSSEYDVKFFTSDDGSTWSQLGSTVTGTTGVTSIDDTTAAVNIGATGTTGTGNNAKGTVYRARIYASADGSGSPVFDADFTGQAALATTFTEDSTNSATVTVNTSGSGYVATLVPASGYVQPTGVANYQPSSYSLLDFGATQDFTAVVFARRWGAGTNGGFLQKKPVTGSAAGWSLTETRMAVSDGGVQQVTASVSWTSGTAHLQSGGREGTTTLWRALDGGARRTTAIPSTNVDNAVATRVGTFSNGTYYADMEFTAAAIWRRALTAGEIATLNSYFQGREGA